MRLSSVVAAFLLSTLAAAGPFSFFGGQNVLDGPDDGRRVPGQSPLMFCSPNHDEYLLDIEYVYLSPNPPAAGQSLLIKAKGKISKDIEEGAYILLTIKYATFITLIDLKADLCEQSPNVDMPCPIEKGTKTIEKSIDLPAEIPPGKYEVVATVNTKDNETITCLTATVEFRMT